MVKETVLQESCGDCLLFSTCRRREGNSAYVTKTGLVNLKDRGSANCLVNFDDSGNIVSDEPSPTAEVQEPIALHYLPKGFVGSRRPSR